MWQEYTNLQLVTDSSHRWSLIFAAIIGFVWWFCCVKQFTCVHLLTTSVSELSNHSIRKNVTFFTYGYLGKCERSTGLKLVKSQTKTETGASISHTTMAHSSLLSHPHVRHRVLKSWGPITLFTLRASIALFFILSTPSFPPSHVPCHSFLIAQQILFLPSLFTASPIWWGYGV